MVKRICADIWQGLNSVSRICSGRGMDNSQWTYITMLRLCEAGKALGYYVCTKSVTGANHGEWLFDQVWMAKTPGQLKRIGLVVECEWSLKQDDILYDFRKLLVARADVRLMIFQARTPQRVKALFDLLRAETQGFTQQQSGDHYMLAGYDMQNGEFLRDGFRIKNAYAVEDVPFLSRDRQQP